MSQAKDHDNLGTPYAVRAVQRVLDILDLLQESPDGVSLQDIAGAARLPKSSAYRYLATLEARNYVQRDPETNQYRFGLAFLPSHTRHLELLAARARPILEQLRDRFEETVNLGVLDGNRVAYLEILESPKGVRLAARPGDRDPIHSTGLGKAIASLLGDDAVRTVLELEGMPRLTSRTITDADAYLRELETVRRKGFAVDNGENEDEGRCVAVPIPGGRVLAAISVSAPSSRMALRDTEEIAKALKKAASAFDVPTAVADG